MSGGGSAGSTSNVLTGGTDFTEIGNISDQLKMVQYGQTTTVIPSATVSTFGSSASIDTNGYGFISTTINITAISGSGAYIQPQVQSSNDGSNWATLIDTQRLTATGLTSFMTRISSRYFRINYLVGGTTPSITFSVISTLKPYFPARTSSRFFYSDLDLTTQGNMSSTFDSIGCSAVTVVYIRAADGGNNGTVRLAASNDGANWLTISGNLAANQNTTNTVTSTGTVFRFYNLQCTANTNAGTRVLDIQWSAN